jgi:hypothetical protein
MQEQQEQSSPFFRWILCIPAALVAGWLAWFAVSIGNKLTIGSQGLDPNSFLPRLFIETVSHAVMGAVFVYAGAKVAPSSQKTVAYGLSGLALVGAGFMLFPAFLIKDYWAVWAGFSLIFGAGAIAYSINVGEVDI